MTNEVHLCLQFPPVFSCIKLSPRLRACTEGEYSPHTSGLASMVQGKVPVHILFYQQQCWGSGCFWAQDSQRYGSGSGSFYHQAKILRKTLILTVMLLLFDFLSLKNDVNVPSKSKKQKNFFLNQFFVGVLKVNDEKSRIRIRIHQSEAWIRGSGSMPICHGSATLISRPCRRVDAEVYFISAQLNSQVQYYCTVLLGVFYTYPFGGFPL